MTIQIKKPLEMTTERPRVYCKDYLPLLEGCVMMLFSGGGVGKSFASIRSAIEFVEENKYKKAALWLTEDAEGETRHRYDAIIGEYKKPRDYYDDRISFIVQEPLKLTSLSDGNSNLTDDFYEIRLALQEYDLVVLDPLLQFNGGDENNNTHAGVLMGGLKTWASEEIKTILLLHHASSKMGGGVKSRGAGEWVNGCRGVYELQYIMDSSGEKVDTAEKDRRNFVLTKDNGLSYWFRDKNTGMNERKLDVFPRHAVVEESNYDDGFIKFSLADHNNQKNPKGFDETKCKFYDLHKLVTQDKCYSPYLFKDGHRKGENNLGGANILCFDIDDGLTLAEGVERFKGYMNLIITTKSHGVKGDRFRVFLNLNEPLNVPDYDYSDFMDYMFKKIGNVDPSTKDLARFYFASPTDAEYMYSDSERLFDWRRMYQEMKRQKIINELLTRKDKKPEKRVYQTEQSNTLPKDTPFTTRNGVRFFSDLRDSLPTGDKVIVECRHGYGHNGGGEPKDNPAAFVKKSDNGNVYYCCSGAKCANEDVLWCED